MTRGGEVRLWGETDRQAGIQIDRQTGKQINKQTDRDSIHNRGRQGMDKTAGRRRQGERGVVYIRNRPSMMS